MNYLDIDYITYHKFKACSELRKQGYDADLYWCGNPSGTPDGGPQYWEFIITCWDPVQGEYDEDHPASFTVELPYVYKGDGVAARQRELDRLRDVWRQILAVVRAREEVWDEV